MSSTGKMELSPPMDVLQIRTKEKLENEMKLQILATVCMTSALLAAPALAQTGDRGPSRAELSFTSPDEQAMYEDNPGIADFFTDDTMQEMKSEEDMKTAYDAMGDRDRDEIEAACDRVSEKRGSYGTITQGMCARIDAM